MRRTTTVLAPALAAALALVHAAPAPAAGPDRRIVLVHGLNGEGWTWTRVQPALLDAGYAVSRFAYSSADPIEVSSRRLVDFLAALRAGGTRRVDLVAHSMGGLVARDALTRPDGYAGDGGGDGRLPAVDRLLMIGTPHRGADLARLPGSSCAARDLRPGSPFLVALNARPLPAHTRITAIAGRLVPVSFPCVDAALAGVTRLARRLDLDRAGAWIEACVRDTIASLAGRLGDGVVALDSARLEGVGDVVVIDAGHRALVRGGCGSGSPPAALPVLLDRLDD